jgi:PAS domain-containing protein
MKKPTKGKKSRRGRRVSPLGKRVAPKSGRRTTVEQALRESEARFRELADNISQFAWTADRSGWIYWYNKR